MKYRLIRSQPFSAYMNMGLDEAIMQGIMKGISPPTIRFYTWQPSAVSIGNFQGLHNEVDLKACKAHKVNVVRRLTGGGAVYHDELGELTYSIIGPENDFPKDIKKSYQKICSYLIKGLAGIGIKSDFCPINDILADGKKISGNAQTRRSGVLLQHGTILYDVNVDLMFKLLTVDKAKVSDKLIRSVKKRVTRVKDHSNAGIKELASALEDAFLEDFGCWFDTYSEHELKTAQKLAKEKYSSMGWIALR